jgi:hypothetical protein
VREGDAPDLVRKLNEADIPVSPPPPVVVEPPTPPEPPVPPAHDDGDDDDDDASGSTGIAPGCEKYVQASIEAGLKGDTAAATKAGTDLVKCEGAAAMKGTSPHKQCAALLEAGIVGSKAGNYGAALSSLEGAYACKPSRHTALLAAMAACQVPDAARAKPWLDKLTPSERAKVVATCEKSGATLSP